MGKYNCALNLINTVSSVIRGAKNCTKPLNSCGKQIFSAKVAKSAEDGLSVIKTSGNNCILLDKFLGKGTSNVDEVFRTFDFTSYGKNGIPLKYSRGEFIDDIQGVLESLPKGRQKELLSQFNLKFGLGDIDGIPNIQGQIEESLEARKIKGFIEKFYKQNETTVSSPEVKEALDSVIKGFPEFNMTIGKVQHGTHVYSVDVHSLNVLQRAMQNPEYSKLSDEGKQVLKLTALMHDFGKMGNVITPGHAAVSREEAELLLKHYDFPQNIKDRILTQVENHHWFEAYNRGFIDEKDVAEIFQTPENLAIAKMLAKGDFESVNPLFHLGRMNPLKMLSQEEFDKEFAEKMAKITIS